MTVDINISGSGSVGTGEYEKIRVSGSARGEGLIRCEELHVSGSFRHEAVECSGKTHISGSAKINKLAAKEIHVSGSLKCEESLVSEEETKVSGVLQCGKDVKCGELKVYGAAKIGGGVEAEKVELSGAVQCKGLVNAEEIFVRLEGHNEIGSIGGSKITVKSERSGGGLMGFLFGRKDGSLEVKDSIEGDEIYLEHTEAKTVTGKKVEIGEGCKIEKLQYFEEAIISPKAKVITCEKI